MANVNANVTDSVIKQIMEGADPRTAIDAALNESTKVDEKTGYHKEKRIRDGKAQVVNVKNRKRKVHHALTAGQKKAIKKAHSAAANKKRAKSLKKGAKMGLYKEDINLVAEADEEVQGVVIPCPACDNANLEIFVDPEGEETDGTILVCPECGETFVICSTSELEDEDADEDAKEEEKAAEEEVPQDEAVEQPAQAPVAEEAPVSEECGDENKECGDENKECDGENNECGEPEQESGLYFEAE